MVNTHIQCHAAYHVPFLPPILTYDRIVCLPLVHGHTHSGRLSVVHANARRRVKVKIPAFHTRPNRINTAEHWNICQRNIPFSIQFNFFLVRALLILVSCIYAKSVWRIVYIFRCLKVFCSANKFIIHVVCWARKSVCVPLVGLSFIGLR